uniref:Uncharacterized protein n=1 Tax=Anolis carolinensis TaxID=28377 RepID=A0A803SY79_ANOCA
MLPEGGPQPPKGLRHHSCLIVGAFVDAVCNDLYVHDAQSSPGKWFRFLSSNRALKRIRQWTCLLNDKLYLVAGFWVQRSAPWRYPYEVHVFRSAFLFRLCLSGFPAEQIKALSTPPKKSPNVKKIKKFFFLL